MEISTEVSIPFFVGSNVIENETVSHSINKTDNSNFMLAQKTNFRANSGMPVGTRTRNSDVGGRDFIQLDYRHIR